MRALRFLHLPPRGKLGRGDKEAREPMLQITPQPLVPAPSWSVQMEFISRHCAQGTRVVLWGRW